MWDSPTALALDKPGGFVGRDAVLARKQANAAAGGMAQRLVQSVTSTSVRGISVGASAGVQCTQRRPLPLDEAEEALPQGGGGQGQLLEVGRVGVAGEGAPERRGIGGNAGVGYLLNVARQEFDTETIFAIIVFIQKRPRGLFALKGRAVEA